MCVWECVCVIIASVSAVVVLSHYCRGGVSVLFTKQRDVSCLLAPRAEDTGVQSSPAHTPPQAPATAVPENLLLTCC